jgi:hypothetical protein
MHYFHRKVFIREHILVHYSVIKQITKQKITQRKILKLRFSSHM